jgi:outer membrane lipoprotein-sorting protein
MNEKKMISILVMVVVSTVFMSSGAFANIATAQTSKTDPSKDYKDFQQCLTSAEGAKGYATKQEIKDCYSPIYSPNTNSSTASSNVSPPAQ